MHSLNLQANGDAPAWQRRYRIPTLLQTQLARMNPNRGLAIIGDAQTGTPQLYAWDIATGTLHPLTDAAVGVSFGGISPDGEWVYYLQDDDGDEIGQVVRVPFTGGAAEAVAPNLPPVALWALTQSYDGRKVGLTLQDQDGFKLYIQQKTALQLLHKTTQQAFGPMLSFAADFAVVATTERGDSGQVALLAYDLRADGDTQSVKVLQEDDATFSPLQFSPVEADTRFLATTNATGFDRPLLWDVLTGDRIDLPFVGMDGDISALDWSPDGEKLLLMQFVEARYQLYCYDLTHSTLHKLAHPHGTYYSGYFYTNDEIFVHWADATHPPQIIALDATTGTQTRTVLTIVPDALPESQPWQSVRFPSSGGQMIQAWLATPSNRPAPYPTVIHLHGGPTAVQTKTFSAEAQAWLDHGFAYVSLNYRGSTTFGRQFEQAILGNLGHLEVDDLIAARQYLGRQGIADPAAIFLTGSAYGGYLTLQAMGKQPHLWAGGMAERAIADWTRHYLDQPEALRGYQAALFGGTPDELPDQHAQSSPITFAEAVIAPLLIQQGSDDPYYPAPQMQAYVQRLQQAGKAVQIEWFSVQSSTPATEQRIQQQARRLQWALDVLAARTR